jgi:DNA-binding NtrC family response regulator
MHAMSFAADRLIGCSKAIENIRLLAQKLAHSSLPVLIQGETGTGKEVVARYIHQHSSRRNKPFVVIDCSTLTPALIESELFGYNKGAFTGADSARTGLVLTADGGTLFLDEVGELPVLLQSRLLRLIQEREFRPVGANTSLAIDCRFIAATNRDLNEEMAEGRFRADLYFRMNAIGFTVPSLRYRKEDIPPLVRHFLREIREQQSIIEMIENDLAHYHWPGNVRELENIVVNAVTLGDLPGTATTLNDTKSERLAHGIKPLSVLEQDGIVKALHATGGNCLKAAKLLGIGKTTLHRKLKQLHIR